MAWRLRCAVIACAGLCGAASTVAGGEPVGSEYLKTLTIDDPPFGERKQEAYPWDGVRNVRPFSRFQSRVVEGVY